MGHERRLGDGETGLEAANGRAAHERRASAEQFAERQRDLQAQIAQEVDERRVIEETLAHAVRDRDDAEKRHASGMADAAAQSRDLEAALRLTRQDLDSQSADVERLTQREAGLASMLADATTSHRNLERR